MLEKDVDTDKGFICEKGKTPQTFCESRRPDCNCSYANLVRATQAMIDSYKINATPDAKIESKGLFSRAIERIRSLYHEIQKAEKLYNSIPLDKTELEYITGSENTRRILGDF